MSQTKTNKSWRKRCAEAVAQSVSKVKSADAPSSNVIADIKDGSVVQRRRAAQLLRIQRELVSGKE